MHAAGDTSPILPDDPEALRALLAATLAKCEALTEERDSLATERDALAARNEKLQHLLAKLRRMQFVRSATFSALRDVPEPHGPCEDCASRDVPWLLPP